MKVFSLLVAVIVIESMFVPAYCLAGWFGPKNYEECILEKMKGQDKSLLRVARAACLKAFPVRKGGANIDPKQLILYPSCYNDGFFRGSIFNNDPNFTITQITVEMVPANETNPLNKYSPRFLNITVFAEPNSMSSNFEVEKGDGSCSYFTFRITQARGYN